jgi:hypothetical protein
MNQNPFFPTEGVSMILVFDYRHQVRFFSELFEIIVELQPAEICLIR